MAAEDKNNEVFLDHKTKEKWVDPKTGSICWKLYPRSLCITWGFDGAHWQRWDCFKERSDENMEVARLCWLRVTGKCKISDLSPRVVYEVVLVVKLRTEASGRELPVSLLLLRPDGTFGKSKMNLLNKPSGERMELNMGSFLAMEGGTGELELEFDLSGTEGHGNVGLNIEEAIIRPKSS